jgi:hypothetical protein
MSASEQRNHEERYLNTNRVRRPTSGKSETLQTLEEILGVCWGTSMSITPRDRIRSLTCINVLGAEVATIERRINTHLHPCWLQKIDKPLGKKHRHAYRRPWQDMDFDRAVMRRVSTLSWFETVTYGLIRRMSRMTTKVLDAELMLK